MDRYTELKNMSFDALAGVASRYPWFGAAKKLLCAKMVEIGGDWGISQFSDAAMYVPSREKVSSLLRKGFSCSDKEVENIIKKYISSPPEEEAAPANTKFRGVGDYFSRDQYAKVRQKGDDSFRSFFADGADASPVEMTSEFDLDFCTETLAQIYEEQGYYQQARDIYSKLILAYPEKNAYFAALIEKLDREIKN